MTSAKANRKDRLEKLHQAVADNPTSARAHFRLGTALLKTQAIRQGEDALRKAVELDPKSVESWVNLGGALMTHWDFEGCIQANAKALEIKPDLVHAHYNKGLGHMYLGQPDEMLTCFQRVVELDPSHPAGTYHLAVAQLAAKQLEEAQATLTKAMQLGYSPEPKLLKALELEKTERAEKAADKTSNPDSGSDQDNKTP